MGLWGFLNPHFNNNPRKDAKRALVNNWLDNVEPAEEHPFDIPEQSDPESEPESESEQQPILLLSPAMRKYDISNVSFSPWRNAGDSALQSSTPYSYAAPAGGGPTFSYSRRLEPVPYPTWNDAGNVHGEESEESEEESEDEEEEDEEEEDEEEEDEDEDDDDADVAESNGTQSSPPSVEEAPPPPPPPSPPPPPPPEEDPEPEPESESSKSSESALPPPLEAKNDQNPPPPLPDPPQLPPSLVDASLPLLEDVSLPGSLRSPLSHPETNESASSDLQYTSPETEVVAEEAQVIEQPVQAVEEPVQAIEEPAQAQEIGEPAPANEEPSPLFEDTAPAIAEPAQEVEKAIDEPEPIIEAVVPPLPLGELEEALPPPPPPPPPPQENETVLEIPAKQEIDDVLRPESPNASKSVAFDPSVQDPKGGRLGKKDKKSERVRAARAQAIKDEKRAKEDVQKEKERAKRKALGEKTKVIKNAKGQIVVITEKKVAPTPEKKEASARDVKSSPSKSSKKPDKKSKGKEREEKRNDKPLKGVLKEPTPSFDGKPKDTTSEEPSGAMMDDAVTSEDVSAPEKTSQEEPAVSEQVNDTEAIGDGTLNPFLCAAREWAAELRSRARSWRAPAQKSGCKVEKWRQSVPLYTAVENLSRNSLALSIGSLPEDSPK